MNFQNILVVGVRTRTNPEEIVGSARALRKKNTGKGRKVDLLWLDPDPSRYRALPPQYIYKVGTLESGGVDYTAVLGIYVVCHITGFLENLGELLHRQLPQKVRIGCLCFVVCKFIGAENGRDKVVDPLATEPSNELLVQALRELRANGLVPAKVTAWDKPIFVYYQGSPDPPEAVLPSEEGRKFLLVRGGKMGFAHDNPRSRREHKASWAYDPDTGVYRMDGEVQDAVAALDVLTLALSSSSTATEDRPPWQLDEEARACNACGTAFTFWNRRHHCRQCGLIFCDECSDFEKVVTRPVAPRGERKLQRSNGRVRVCKGCHLKERP